LIDSKGDYILIDVREVGELVHGVIPSSINIPMGLISEKLGGFNKDDKLIFYCKFGIRSGEVAKFAMEKGFINVKSYSGSIWAWSEIDDNVERYDH